MSRYWFLGVVVIGATALAVTIGISILSVTPAPLSTIKSFVFSIETNDYDAAYSTFHDDLRRREPFLEFVEVWEDRSSFLQEANAFWSTVIENETAEIMGRFTAKDRDDWSAVFKLIKQDGRWLMIEYEIREGQG